jgi:hypothetical protein
MHAYANTHSVVKRAAGPQIFQRKLGEDSALFGNGRRFIEGHK